MCWSLGLLPLPKINSKPSRIPISRLESPTQSPSPSSSSSRSPSCRMCSFWFWIYASPAPGQIDWMPFGLLSGENKKCCEWALSNWYGYEWGHTYGSSSSLSLFPHTQPSLNQPCLSLSLCLSVRLSVCLQSQLNSRDELLVRPLFLCPAPWQLWPQNEALAVYLWHAWHGSMDPQTNLRSPRWLGDSLKLLV